jgi:hypothetical protein
LLIVSPKFIFVWAPLFVACFGLSVFAIANRRFISGVMMILLFTVPTIFVIARIVNDAVKGIEKGVKKLEEEKREFPANRVNELTPASLRKFRLATSSSFTPVERLPDRDGAPY